MCSICYICGIQCAVSVLWYSVCSICFVVINVQYLLCGIQCAVFVKLVFNMQYLLSGIHCTVFVKLVFSV